MNNPKGLVSCFLLFILISACKKEGYVNINDNEKRVHTSNFVGSNTCVACHKEQFKEWQGSHHDFAMQIANDSTVLGNFDNVKVNIDGVTYFFFKKDKDFIVRIKEIDGSEIEYKITYTFA